MMGLYLLAAHAAGDWVLQTDRMAVEKFESWVVRAQHVAVYIAVVTATAAFATAWTVPALLLFAALVGISHYIIDSRRWKEPVKGFETRALWFDQAYHIIALAVAAGVAGWSA